MKRLGPVLASALLIGCTTQHSAPYVGSCAHGPDDSYVLCIAGDRNRMLDTGDLGASIALNQLPPDDELIAVGPVEGLRGEITIYRGEAFVSVIEDSLDRRMVSSVADASDNAIFLAYGSARQWEAVRLPATVAGFDEIEAVIAEQARARGLRAPFPFRIEGTARALTYHVIFKTGDAPHHRAEHKKAKVMFDRANEPIRIAGVWADEAGVGRYTHPGRYSHMHALIEDPAGSGHIDALILAKGAVLYLPKRQPAMALPR